MFAICLCPQQGSRLWIGIDASSIARPAVRTSADRTIQPVHNLSKSKRAITYGWSFRCSTIY
ncbi:hypothetical protein KSZ_68780 [Dictyobacter formicarum]|uniref:Uncharacterized protein n=1 Tax=Dictyobacter formicarum TaxID=2778368 RepID=A0ABQ3VRH4_9CHLR|nr:hypothetical protein KSZ_68780 [Dictyobacter formicarum]